MMDATLVSLEVATRADETLLANLLELYIHDLSPAFPNRIRLGADGRYGYSRLPLYWSEPDRRFPFLIKSAEETAGFVLATLGSPVVTDPDVLDVAEFFVLRGHRRSGVGRAAAFALWQRLPGRWTVRSSEGVPSAVKFWRRVIAEFTQGTATEQQLPEQPYPRRVFLLDSRSNANQR